jgi:hypothetical protein
MSKEKLLQLYFSKNPSFSNEKIIFTQAGFIKFFNTTYDAAYQQGFRQEADSDEYEEEEEFIPQRPSASLEELLRIFGMSR